MAYVSLVPFAQVESAVRDIMRTYDKEYTGSEFVIMPFAKQRATWQPESIAGYPPSPVSHA